MEDAKIELIDEKGNLASFEVLMTFEDSGGKYYMVVAETTKDNNKNDCIPVLIFLCDNDPYNNDDMLIPLKQVQDKKIIDFVEKFLSKNFD